MAFSPDHHHYIATAYISKPPQCADLHDWLLRLVQAVDMEVWGGPIVKECHDEGNEGITGIVLLSTSHAAAHFWDRVSRPYVQFDLYSCQSFDPETVAQLLREFGPDHIRWQLIDRNL